jgi:hypothetical protein
MEFIGMTDEACRRFTIEAEKRHVQFDGEYGYIVPGIRKLPIYAKQDFCLAKTEGRVPSGKRSPEARARRAAKYNVLRKGWQATAIEEPLVVRPIMGTKEQRRGWFSSGLRWSEYRSTIPMVECLAVQKRPFPVSKPVRDALRIIYSRVVLERVGDVYFPNREVTPLKVFRYRVPEPVAIATKPIPEPRSRSKQRRRATVIDGTLYESAEGGIATMIGPWTQNMPRGGSFL